MIKKYLQYIKESITTDIDGLLDSIREEKVDFYEIGLSNDDFINKNIDYIYDNDKFNNKLFVENLKKSDIESTTEIENFLRKNIDMKFFLLYDRNKTVLDNPKYLILQYYKNNKWYPVEIYLIKSDIKKFYDKLTAKNIELKYNNVIYNYITSNSGNNWQLKNKNDKNDMFKELLDNEDIRVLIKKGSELKILD